MSKPNKHVKEANRLLRLTESEKLDPSEVFEEFFSNFHLRDLREELWDWLCSALANEMSWHQTGNARSNLLFLYENLEKLAEAAYIMHRRNERNKK